MESSQFMLNKGKGKSKIKSREKRSSDNYVEEQENENSVPSKLLPLKCFIILCT